jgi:hypothetical protein
MIATGVALVCVVSAVIAHVTSRLHLKLVGLLLAVLAPALVSYGMAFALFMSPWSHPSEDSGGLGFIIMLIWSGCGVLVSLLSYFAFWGLQVRRRRNRIEKR